MDSRLCITLIFILQLLELNAQLVLLESGIQYQIDFEDSFPEVNEDAFVGEGLQAEALTGQLDSDAWLINGCSDGDSQFSSPYLNGDFARGLSNGGESIGGLYSFLVSENNYALGLQATSSDLSPGELVLKVENKSGFAIERLELSYILWIFNDQNRSQKISSAYSFDNINYTPIAFSEQSSAITADQEPQWEDSTFVFALDLSPIENNSFFYLKWLLEDDAGSGSRDEWAIDAIGIKITNNSCIHESFLVDSLGNLESTEDFTFIGIDSYYISPANYGAHSPSARMDDNLDQLITPTVSNAFALKFWMKAQGNTSASSLLIEGYNGSSWIAITNYTSLPTSGSIYSIQNISAYSQFRFTYLKQNGNLAIDDIQISCGDCNLAPIPENLSGIISFSDSYCNQSSISWTGNSSDYYLVLATEKSAIASFPVDHHSYSSNNNFAMGEVIEDSVFVVYNGSENEFILSQLKSGSEYLIKVFPYNGLSCEENYAASSINAILQSPACGQCPYLKAALINACNESCSVFEGSNEFLILNSGEFSIPTTNADFNIFYENQNSSLLNEVMLQNTAKIDQLNALSNCPTFFVDALSIPSIPAQSDVLICNNSICLDTLDVNAFCNEALLYVVFCQSSEWNPLGEFINSGYVPQHFKLDFSAISPSCILNYSYIPNDIPQEDGAYISFSSEGGMFTEQSIVNNCKMNIGTLPLVWGFFEAQIEKKEVKLNWESPSEQANKGFWIRRSADGNIFEEIGWVDSKGDTEIGSFYSFNDSAPIYGLQYYQLMQEDMDGQIAFSKSIAVNYLNEISVFQNQNSLNVRGLNEAGRVELYSIQGKIIYKRELNTNESEVEIDLAVLSSGIYIVRVFGKGMLISRKVYWKRK